MSQPSNETVDKAFDACRVAQSKATDDLQISQKAKARQNFVRLKLVPMGKEMFDDEERWTSEAAFKMDDEVSNHDKCTAYELWAEDWKNGVFTPESAPTAKKKVTKKRGNALDDIKPEADIKEARDEVDDIPDTYDVEPEVEATEAITQEEPKPKEKQVSKSKSKKELLLELLEEEESGGLTEQDVERIAKRVCIKILTDLTTEVNEESMAVLRNYEEDTKDAG